MKFNALSRLVVLAALFMGFLAPSLTSAAAPAASSVRTPSFADIELLLAQANDKKIPLAQGADDLVGVLGGERADFEDEFGEPADDADADDFAIGEVYEDIRGYESINVFWDDDVALHIQLNARSGWDEDKSLSLAEQFLPGDVDLDSRPDELDGGELLYAGTSDALGDAVTRSTYRSFDVGGSAGDLRVILIPGDDEDTFATVDIAIGAGDEYAGGGAEPTEEVEPTPKPKKTPKADPTEESSGGDADEYLSNIRTEVDARTEELNRFTEILSTDGDISDADFSELIDIVVAWTDLPTYDAPSGYSEIDDAYTSMNKNLTDGALNFTNALLAEPLDSELLSEAIAQFGDASTLATELDGLLTDEGF